MSTNISNNRYHTYHYDHDGEIEYDHAPIIKKAQERLLARQLSLTEEEKVVLKSIFVDKKPPSSTSTSRSTSTRTITTTSSKTRSSSSLTDEMLFNHAIVNCNDSDRDNGRDDVDTSYNEKKYTKRSKPPLSPTDRPSSIKGAQTKGTPEPPSFSLESPSATPLPQNKFLKKRDKPKLLASSSIPRPVGLISRPKAQSAGSIMTKTYAKLFSPQQNQPNSDNHTALWLVHEKGLMPPKKKNNNKNKAKSKEKEIINDWKINLRGKKKKMWEIEPETVLGDLNDDEDDDGTGMSTTEALDNVMNTLHSEDDDIITDATLSPCTRHSDSTTSTLDEDYGFEHFDCWQLLIDEYAQDFGFAAATDSKSTDEKCIEITNPSTSTDDVTVSAEATSSNDSDVDLHQFKILGTGVDDISAQPHVLSPPLMDSLLNFVPDSQKFENFWLKYSLIRDGSCLETFRQYTRAASNTILAIQTTEGDVFGSFTTSPWENHGMNSFGSGNSFVWKMRYSRKTNCSSLYDQAHIESEIDVFPFSGFNACVQIMTNSMIALGGTEIEKTSTLGFDYEDYQKLAGNYKSGNSTKKNNQGFAIALHDDLSHGTTSPCATFCSPSLLTSGGEFFQVLNLELWTFTPVDSVNEAQKLEMRKFFVLHHNTSTGTKTNSSSEFTSKDLIQESFYHRLGK